MKLRFQKAPWNTEQIDRVKFISENYVLSQHEPRGNGLLFQNEIKEKRYFSFRSEKGFYMIDYLLLRYSLSPMRNRR